MVAFNESNKYYDRILTFRLLRKVAVIMFDPLCFGQLEQVNITYLAL